MRCKARSIGANHCSHNPCAEAEAEVARNVSRGTLYGRVPLPSPLELGREVEVVKEEGTERRQKVGVERR